MNPLALIVDTTITLGNLLTIIGFFASVMFAWAKFDKRLALLEQALFNIGEYIRDHKQEAAQDRKELDKVKLALAALHKA